MLRSCVMRIFSRRSTRTLATGIASAPVADDAYWRSVSGWQRPTLATADVAALVGVSPAAVRQYRSRDAHFPQPLHHEPRAIWSEEQIFDWITAYRPKQLGLVPRLYHPASAAPAPAVFIAAETIALQTAGSASSAWVVHLWQPDDHRGPVAVAYGEHGTIGEAPRCARELLRRLPQVSVVAVVTDDIDDLDLDDSDRHWQPRLALAEHRPPSAARTGDVVSTWIGWFRLAALLRVNLPWWPHGLRGVEAFAAWRPNTPPQSIRPHTRWYSESILRNLLAAAEDPDAADLCRPTVEEINRLIEADFSTPPAGPDVPGDVERPGIIQAAHPHYRIIDTPVVHPAEGLRLLRLKAPSPTARSAARYLLRHRPEVAHWACAVITVDPADCGALAAEWISRLTPIGDPQTFGSSFAMIHLEDTPPEQPPRWWMDPHVDDCWIVQDTTTGMYYATVGTCAEAASGTLAEFELATGGTSAFFRDGRAVVWPMPVRSFGGYYTCGYNGTGPNELITAVTVLRQRANLDLDQREIRHSLTPPAGLRRLIHTHATPLSVSAAELDEFDRAMPPKPVG